MENAIESLAKLPQSNDGLEAKLKANLQFVRNDGDQKKQEGQEQSQDRGQDHGQDQGRKGHDEDVVDGVASGEQLTKHFMLL